MLEFYINCVNIPNLTAVGEEKISLDSCGSWIGLRIQPTETYKHKKSIDIYWYKICMRWKPYKEAKIGWNRPQFLCWVWSPVGSHGEYDRAVRSEYSYTVENGLFMGILLGVSLALEIRMLFWWKKWRDRSVSHEAQFLSFSEKNGTFRTGEFKGWVLKGHLSRTHWFLHWKNVLISCLACSFSSRKDWGHTLLGRGFCHLEVSTG